MNAVTSLARPLLLLVLILGIALPATAAESLMDLIEAYEASVLPAAERSEAGYQAQEDALEAIAVLKTEQARAGLMRLLIKYGEGDYRQSALILGALVRYGDPEAVRMAISWVEDRRDPVMMDRLHTVLAEIEVPTTLRYVRESLLRGSTPAVKIQILRAFATRKDPTVLPTLLGMTREDNPSVRIEAIESLGILGSRKARPVLQAFLRDADVDVRAITARALGRLGDKASVPALLRALEDESSRVIEAAAIALGLLEDPRAIPALIDGLTDTWKTQLRLSDAFTQALQNISGKGIHDDPELWRAWWATVKDKTPFEKAKEKPGTKSVAGPHYHDVPVRSSRVVFVLDVSRSMGWNERLKMAKKELNRVLGKLPKTTYFNVVVFSQHAWVWRKKLQKATSHNVTSATRWIRAQKPLLGTNTYAALNACFQDPDADTIFLLSDGHPSQGPITDPKLLLGKVRDWNRLRDVRIHGILLQRGPLPSSYRSLENPDAARWFMEQLCAQNGGRFREIK